MRKQISVTHERVIELFESQENVSKYIEKCVLAYEDFKEHDYITRAEVMELLKGYNSPTASTPQKITKDDLSGVLDL